jgi:F-type H+-transporting ATPase subunit epsilon
MSATIQIEIVSTEKSLYSGDATMVVAPGVSGELGILPQHAPLLTRIKPGVLKIFMEDGNQDLFYVSGGVLEVQPEKITVLADVAERGDDLDEERAQQARQAAEEKLASATPDLDYATAQAELARAVAQLQIIQKLRKRR